jgi:hypothetical protein
MRVQAVRLGQYDQVLREVGEVFDLIDNEDGSMPLRMKRIPILDDKGKDTGEFTEEVYLDREGNALHRDFAPADEELTGKGAFKGETFAPGWMVEVPQTTVCGIYEPNQRFSMKGHDEPVPIQRVIKASNQPANLPPMTPMRGKNERQRRSA